MVYATASTSPGRAHWNEAHSFGPDGRIGGAAGCAHRRHDAGMNRVGADIVLAVLHRDPFGHQPHRCLRGVIGDVYVLAADDAGIVDQHVELAEMPGGSSHD